MRSRGTGFDVVGELPALRRYALALTRDDHDAEDLVQDALLRACAKRHQFDETRELRAWLLSILHNLFVDGTRARNAERRRAEQAAELREPYAAPAQDEAVRLSGVLANVAELPEDQRAALHLVAVEGLAYGDAAAVLGVPIGTLMSRLGRARAALRRMDEVRAAPAPRLRIVGEAHDDAD